ncbi:hypothetical protein D3C78_1019930 [compost metagenome]
MFDEAGITDHEHEARHLRSGDQVVIARRGGKGGRAARGTGKGDQQRCGGQKQRQHQSGADGQRDGGADDEAEEGGHHEKTNSAEGNQPAQARNGSGAPFGVLFHARKPSACGMVDQCDRFFSHITQYQHRIPEAVLTAPTIEGGGLRNG